VSPIPRVLFYCHDSYGLGHVRRTLTLSRCLGERQPAAAQLLVTGSPLAHRLVPEDDVDYVKLPSVLHTPAGMNGEMVAPLRSLRESRPHTRLVLGLRDVVDDAARVRESWARDGVYQLLDDLYDRILVYGEQSVYDVARAYALSAHVRQKTRYVGYLGRSATRPAEAVRAELALRTETLVLITAGGGGDGYPVLRTYIDALRDEPRTAARFDSLLVTGPLMPPEEREHLARLVPRHLPVRLVDFVEDGMSTMATADAVVSMGGYNSVSEIMSSARPAVIVPRVEPRREQLIRAERLSRRGLVRLLHPAELTPRRLLNEVRTLLSGRRRPSWPVSLDGTTAAVRELEALLPRSDAAARPELRLAAAR
jgi:predicted glycosyltransferase